MNWWLKFLWFGWRTYSYRDWGEEVVDGKEVEHWEVIADDCAGFGWGRGWGRGRALAGRTRWRVSETRTAIVWDDNDAERHDGETPHTEPKMTKTNLKN